MKIQINYGSSVLAIPGAVIQAADRATATDMRVLLALCAAPSMETAEEISNATGISSDEVSASIAFWRGTGILTVGQESKKKATPAVHTPAAVAQAPADASPAKEESPAPTVRKIAAANSLPRYTSQELADLLESRKETSTYLDECQRIWGKMFNIHEHNVILGLTDYLGLEWDYVLTLLAFCGAEQDKRGVKRSLHAVEAAAFNFYDEGVTDLPALQEKLRRIEQMEDMVKQLRRMFGMGDRILTPSEKKKFSTWVYEYKYGMDVITKAFEITVDVKGNPNLRYMDSILANWNRDGIRTPEDADRANEAFRNQQNGSKAGKQTTEPARGSFDTNDFFAAAVARSLGEDYVPTHNDSTQGDT